MRWYQGGITDAVALTRQKNAIFVVFIQGTDEKSGQFGELFDDANVSGKLESDLFVAIRLEGNSVPHQQFAQIYKEATVPSVFFIGKTGAAIGVITEPANPADFLEKINGIIGLHTGKNESFIKSEQASSSASSNVVCENGVCRRVSPTDDAASSESSSSQQELSTEEKVEKAKELIEKKREQKELEEKEKERASELERRKMGQDVQKMKRWQEDQQLKNIMEEREREKQQERAARERVLAQIAQDKADRAARFSNNTQQQSQIQNNSPPEPKIQRINSNTTRLQFKLPDGSSHTQEFASNEPLEVVRAYISANLNLSFTNYVLSTAFPRREFTDNNNSESLADLGLAPNAVVLVLPASGQVGAVSTRGGGFVAGLLWTLVSPFFTIFEYVRSFIFGGGARQQTTGREGVKRAAPPGGEASTSRSPPKRRTAETTVIKRQGNIHRLSDKTDSDDENNTWNGNSTQQM